MKELTSARAHFKGALRQALKGYAAKILLCIPAQFGILSIDIACAMSEKLRSSLYTTLSEVFLYSDGKTDIKYL